MYIESEHIIYSPSDLTLYMDSPFASWMERSALLNPDVLSSVDEEDALMGVLQHKGAEHEQAVLNSFLDRGLSVAQIAKGPNALEDTLAAMQSGVDIVYQAALFATPFRGYADFLVKVAGKSHFGDFHYEVWDTKLAKSVKPYFIVQLCCYADMLAAVQGLRPDHVVVVLGNAETIRCRTNDYFYYYENLKNRFLQAHQTFSMTTRRC